MKNNNRNIPRGHYCYDEKGTCRFWRRLVTEEYQNDGYCTLLGYGDNAPELGWAGFLWDLVKECEHNHD